MDRFLDSVFLDNPVRDYFWVFGVIVFAILLKRLISKYIAILLCKLFQRAWPSFDQKKFVELIMQPMGTFLVVSISIIALYRLNYPDAFSFTIYQYPLQNVFISIGILIQVIAFTWLLMRFIDFIALVLEIRANKTQDQSDNQLIVFFRDFLKVIIGCMISSTNFFWSKLGQARWKSLHNKMAMYFEIRRLSRIAKTITPNTQK